MPDQDKNQQTKFGAESVKIMGVAFELGFIIALPIIAFGLIGKHFDEKKGTGYFIYIGIVLAIIMTSTWIYKRFASMIQKLNEAAEMNKKQNGNKEDKEL